MVRAYRIKKIIPDDKTVIITGLPFSSGDKVEILIVRQHSSDPKKRYPLRGKPVQYEHPFDSVAEDDWEAAR